MILGKHMLQGRISQDILQVTPEPTCDQYQPASLDLTLGPSVYDPASDEEYDIPLDGHSALTIPPNGFLLGHTNEVVGLPNNLAAQVAGRSTFGRLGVGVHVTAGWIDPGFEGDITLELANHAPWPVDIYPGERVAQLVVHQVIGGVAYDGSYQGQRGPNPAARQPQPDSPPNGLPTRGD